MPSTSPIAGYVAPLFGSTSNPTPAIQAFMTFDGTAIINKALEGALNSVGTAITGQQPGSGGTINPPTSTTSSRMPAIVVFLIALLLVVAGVWKAVF